MIPLYNQNHIVAHYIYTLLWYTLKTIGDICITMIVPYKIFKGGTIFFSFVDYCNFDHIDLNCLNVSEICCVLLKILLVFFCNCLNYFVIFNRYVVKYVFIFWHWCCFVRDRSVVWKHMSIVFFPMFEKVLLLIHYNHVSLVDLVCDSMSIFYCKSIYYRFTIWSFIMTSSVMLTLSYDITSYSSLLTVS